MRETRKSEQVEGERSTTITASTHLHLRCMYIRLQRDLLLLSRQLLSSVLASIDPRAHALKHSSDILKIAKIVVDLRREPSPPQIAVSEKRNRRPVLERLSREEELDELGLLVGGEGVGGRGDGKANVDLSSSSEEGQRKLGVGGSSSPRSSSPC